MVILFWGGGRILLWNEMGCEWSKVAFMEEEESCVKCKTEKETVSFYCFCMCEREKESGGGGLGEGNDESWVGYSANED